MQATALQPVTSVVFLSHLGTTDAWIALSVESKFVCPHSKTKMAWAIDTEFGKRMLYGRTSACIDPEVKKVKVKLTQLQTPSWLHDY